MKKLSNRKNVGVIESTTTVNTQTGEITEEKVRKYYKVRFDLYARIFKGSMWGVCNDLTGNDFRVFIYLIGEVRDGSNMVNLGYSNYKELEDGLFRGSSLTSFRRSIRNLIECGIVKRLMQNVYMINPEICHSGSEDDRKETILEYHGVGAVSPLFGDDKADYSRVIGSGV